MWTADTFIVHIWCCFTFLELDQQATGHYEMIPYFMAWNFGLKCQEAIITKFVLKYILVYSLKGAVPRSVSREGCKSASVADAIGLPLKR